MSSNIPFPGFKPVIYHAEKSEAASVPNSPDRVMGPMEYHFYESAPLEKDRIVRSFQRKPVHTLAPRSAIKQANVIERNYPQIREVRRQLFKLPAMESKKLQVENAAIEIFKNGELAVEQGGRKRFFGMHETIRADGKKQKRLYPKAGNGVIALSGTQAAKLINEYKENRPPIPFQKFVESSRQNCS